MQLVIQLAYAGRDFHGSAWQPLLPTVLGAVRQRLARSCAQAPHALSVAARTDRGVDALQNIISARLRGHHDPAAIVGALQRPAADGLRAVRALVWPRRLMARSLPSRRTYGYRLSWAAACGDRPAAGTDGDAAGAVTAGGLWPLSVRLALAPMRLAAGAWLGEHDFRPWARRWLPSGQGCCHIDSIDICKEGAHGAQIVISGRRFLRQMVRRMVMTLVEIGAGLRPPSDAQALRDGLAGDTVVPAMGAAPAAGLCLLGLQLPADLQAALLAASPAVPKTRRAPF